MLQSGMLKYAYRAFSIKRCFARKPLTKHFSPHYSSVSYVAPIHCFVRLILSSTSVDPKDEKPRDYVSIEINKKDLFQHLDLRERATHLVTILRVEIIKERVGLLTQLSWAFRRMDVDNSKSITFDELQKGIHDMKLDFSKEDVEILFHLLDKDKNGDVDFREFVQLLTPPIPDKRMWVIDEAFDKLDINKDGIIGIEELQAIYFNNIRRHPKFLSGEMTEEELLKSFLESMNAPESPDGHVTRQEFRCYYVGVSLTVDDDEFFDLMMRALYGLPPRQFSMTRTERQGSRRGCRCC